MTETNHGWRGSSFSPTWLVFLLVLILVPLTTTAPYVLLDVDQPEASIEFPDDAFRSSEGYLLVILDGVGQDVMLSSDMMPLLQSWKENAAVVPVQTGPLTLSANCVREMMTGVPNAPVDGLRNFNLDHPGGADPWLLAGADPRYSVGMIGSYVMGNMYAESSDVEFVNTFKGHGDYYQGDEETSALLEDWLVSSRHDVVAAHFSGPDKVGHKWGILGDEYKDKMRDVDRQLHVLLQFVPSSWTVVVTADHGMTDSGSHGSAEPDTRNVAAMIAGPAIRTGSAEDTIAQRDLSALMLHQLGLEFPAQVNGIVPLDILDLSSYQLQVVEQWNWEAALLRHTFFHPTDERVLSSNEVDWASVEIEAVSIREFDVVVSILVLSTFLCVGFLTLRSNTKSPSVEFRQFGFLVALVVASVATHASLSYSAMMPRAFGAAAVVWLVATSLGQEKRLTFELPINPHGIAPWMGLILLLTLVFGSLSTAVLSGLIAWVLIWSMAAITGESRWRTPQSRGMYLLTAMAALTIGSLRLWYALVPLYFLLTSHLSSKTMRNRMGQHLGHVWALWLLTMMALVFVHRRFFGTHHLLKLVNMTASSGSEVLTIVGILCGFSLFAAILFKSASFIQRFFSVFAFMLIAFGLSSLEHLFLQQFTLLFIVVLYGTSWAVSKNKPDLAKKVFCAALALHMTVAWGPWAAVVSLLLLLSVPSLVHVFDVPSVSKWKQMNDPHVIVALAVLPWIVWILWWTLMGQVNGLQPCFEGVCPHPRELDPGAVRVQGGYYGGGLQPPTWWMALMVVSPLLITSVALLHRIADSGISLKFYILGQLLIVLGCLALYAYSPIYPRLVFALTWNIAFALAQMFFALCATLSVLCSNHAAPDGGTPVQKFRIS
jgi:hypothetical protein